MGGMAAHAAQSPLPAPSSNLPTTPTEFERLYGKRKLLAEHKLLLLRHVRLQREGRRCVEQFGLVPACLSSLTLMIQ